MVLHCTLAGIPQMSISRPAARAFSALSLWDITMSATPLLMPLRSRVTVARCTWPNWPNTRLTSCSAVDMLRPPATSSQPQLGLGSRFSGSSASSFMEPSKMSCTSHLPFSLGPFVTLPSQPLYCGAPLRLWMLTFAPMSTQRPCCFFLAGGALGLASGTLRMESQSPAPNLSRTFRGCDGEPLDDELERLRERGRTRSRLPSLRPLPPLPPSLPLGGGRSRLQLLLRLLGRGPPHLKHSFRLAKLRVLHSSQCQSRLVSSSPRLLPLPPLAPPDRSSFPPLLPPAPPLRPEPTR
mmetsp:Transcript_66275/g.197191  ORF Transcript_66275/g.197191 Transcript_66275/m.197191 type:complete len:295 (+) Transcript_66275:570-1454(+)